MIAPPTDPYVIWDSLTSAARSRLAKRVCCLGAESTGTTTLAKALAEHFNTNWVPEYGRDMAMLKTQRGDVRWYADDFLQIAETQTQWENEAAAKANRLLICDTNAWVTNFWHRRYVGFDSAEILLQAEKTKPDLYLVTSDEFPFVQDGTRDGEHVRHMMHEWFVEELGSQTVPYVILVGSHQDRMRQALLTIHELFHGSAWDGARKPFIDDSAPSF